jgi:hypothetical protein
MNVVQVQQVLWAPTCSWRVIAIGCVVDAMILQ